MDDGALERFEERRRRLRGHRANHAARHQEAEGVDRIARVGHQHHVAGRGDRLGHVGEAFLGAERGDDLGLGIELHPEAALVIGGLRAPQARNAARRGIAVGAGLADRFLELLDHMRGRRQVRIAHAEIDDVGARVARRRLGAIDLLEDVGRQAADAVKFFHRRGSSAGEPVRRADGAASLLSRVAGAASFRIGGRAGGCRRVGVAAVAVARRDQVVLELLLLDIGRAVEVERAGGIL